MFPDYLSVSYDYDKNKARLVVSQNIRTNLSRLSISKIIRTEDQKRVWLSLIKYFM